MTDQIHLFTRLAQSHKPDCVLSLDGPPPESVASPDELAVTLRSDAVARYAAACRPVYEDLRRIIGQISGLVILAQLTAQRQVTDLPEYDACEARAAQAGDRLGALRVPTGIEPHKAQLDAALQFSRLAMGTFSQTRGGDALATDLDRAGLLIKRAYAHLRAASGAKAGLEMVDLSQACCCCGQQASR